MPVENISEIRRKIIIGFAACAWVFVAVCALWYFGYIGAGMIIFASVAAFALDPDPWIGIWYDLTSRLRGRTDAR